ncbi:hypothetical protein CRV24_000014 [Beauveria bassiana]|nr:hypothetical protein CRV24_000014 [Beauveria bassiana]
MTSTLPRAKFHPSASDALPSPQAPDPFAGRIGANQQFSLDRSNSTDKEVLEKCPDAAPWIPIRDTFSFEQFLEKGLWRAAVVEGLVPGCYIDLAKVSVGSAFVIEFVTDLALILITFGVGLDPRQRGVFGPTLGPILIGIALGEIPGDASAPWSDLISLPTIGYSG